MQQNICRACGQPTDKEYSVKLTDREKQVIEFMAKGLCNKEIAVKLNLKPKTITQYTVIIYKKLRALNRAHAVYKWLLGVA